MTGGRTRRADARTLAAAWAVTVGAAALGCDGAGDTPAARGDRLVFVRDGLVVEPAAGDAPLDPSGWTVTRATGEAIPVAGRALGAVSVLLEAPWEPGEALSVAGTGGRAFSIAAPRLPTSYAAFTVDLGDPGSPARGGEPADSALAFSPDGEALALGTFDGRVRVYDAFTGRERFRRSIAEGFVRQVAFSPDGRTLYVGEQGPDAALYALDARTGAERWRHALAEDLGRSPPPSPDDPYAAYALPGIYRIAVAPEGTVHLAGVHSWIDGAGRHNRSRIYAISADGQRIGAWPADGAADASFAWMVTDREGRRALVAATRNAEGPARAGIPGGSVVSLDLDRLQARWIRTFRPLAPWFRDVYLWQALALADGGRTAAVGLTDGRLLVLREGEDGLVEEREVGAGMPVVVGGVPIAATLGFAVGRGDTTFLLVSRSTVPYGGATTAPAPPSPHPNANAILALGPDGEERWRWQGPHHVDGVSAADDGSVVVVGGGTREGDDRRDLFGVLIFDARPGDATGAERLRAFYPTEGPVFFAHAVHPRGALVAAVEIPGTNPAGDEAFGRCRLHVVR